MTKDTRATCTPGPGIPSQCTPSLFLYIATFLVLCSVFHVHSNEGIQNGTNGSFLVYSLEARFQDTVKARIPIMNCCYRSVHFITICSCFFPAGIVSRIEVMFYAVCYMRFYLNTAFYGSWFLRFCSRDLTSYAQFTYQSDQSEWSERL